MADRTDIDERSESGGTHRLPGGEGARPLSIDALLIGALYGELEPADEARLAAHLESHPADRTALADLTRTRQAVRESRIATVELEPPQSVSAQLLQEAARSAPRPAQRHQETAGWFHRFVRSVAAHPAMAAAAMIVVVVGVTGTLYVRGRDPFADMATVSAPEMHATAQESTPMRALAPAAPATAVGRLDSEGNSAAGSGYGASLDEAKHAPAKQDDAPAATAGVDGDRREAAPEPARSPAKRAKSSGVSGIELRRSEPQPKDFDGRSESRSREQDLRKQEAPRELEAARPPVATTASKPAAPPAGDAATDGARDMKAKKSAATTKAEPAPAPPAASRSTSPKGEIADRTANRADDKPAAEAPLLSWARRQHAQVVSLVQTSDCRAAAGAALEIYSRAPDYYTANVASDRAVRPCLAYLNSEREREDRRTAAKRATAAESPAGAAAASPTPTAPPPARR